MSHLPLEFSSLGLDPEQYYMGDRKSFRGPCISCGGTRRMVVFINGDFPKWYLRCDLCGLEGWVDQFFSGLKSGEYAKSEVVTEIQDTVNDEIARFVQEQEWVRYHENMTNENRLWWNKQGISDEWQDFWTLGYTPERVFAVKDQFHRRPAYTIPKFGLGWIPKSIDFRIVDPPMGAGKYRPRVGLPATCFVARPDYASVSDGNRVVIVEGSKKAMVLSSRLNIQVIGIPGARIQEEAVSLVKDVRKDVVVVLDPDAEKAAVKLAEKIGKGCRWLVLPTKPDDAFIGGYLDPDSFWRLVKMSSRIF